MSALNSHFTNQIIQDFNNFNYLTSFFSYKFKKESEKKIIEKYFSVEFYTYSEVYFSINNKNKRMIKLLRINEDKIYKIIEKIIKKSINVSFDDLITTKLSNEIANEIDTEILNNILHKLKM